MKMGLTVGLIFSVVGILSGAYFAVPPIFETLSLQQTSGHQAGIYFSIIGTIIGLSCAAIGIIVNRETSSS